MSLIVNPFTNNKVHLDEATHVYSHDDGYDLISASQLISAYKQPFDPDGFILHAKAKKLGIPKEDLKRQWEQGKNDASARGNSFHKQAEHFINTGEILDKEYKDVVEQLKERKFLGKLYSETMVCTEEFGIAGTIDLIEDFGDSCLGLLDYKTNKALHFKSKYNKWMKPPISHLSDCNFIHYSLQLSMYEFLLEQRGQWIKSRTILYINPETRKIEEYQTQSLRKEIVNIINDFNIKRF
jgi:ATP-dependent exoDNAse (exonuclease V) beta subunit